MAALGQSVKTTCPYCGVGCGVIATPNADGTVTIAGDPDHPANFGRLCSKGSALGETLSLEDRLLSPMIGDRETSWEEALNEVASKLSAIIAEDGPDAVALYGSGQLLTEDYYVANKFMKGFVGTANIDTNSRLCMASSVAGHKRAFGSDTVPGCYEDLELADLVVLVGSNLAWCHPVLYQRLAAAKEARPGMKILLIDPRRTMSADIADLHLPIAPDGDVTLFAGLLAHLERSGKADFGFVARHTEGLGKALSCAPRSLHEVALASGLPEPSVEQFYGLFAKTEKVVTVYSQGVNQSVSGTDKVNAIINCHLLTGRIGQPGMGPFSVTGQPNAMGGREVGGLANMLAAHMDFGDESATARVRRFWNAPNLAQKPGLKAVELFQAIAEKKVRAVWIMATNPAVSLPDAAFVREALRNCELVIVSDIEANTDTMGFAHIKLPALGWGEKSGTVTNSERRISRQRAFLTAPGQAKPDWWIISQVAQRMGHGAAFDFEGPADIFAEHAALSALDNCGQRDFDLVGLSELRASEYDELAPRQWPVRLGDTKRLFGDGRFFTTSGKARFISTPVASAPEAKPLGFTLNTGRVRDHWHTMTRTGKTARLSAHYGEPFVEIHPEDARRLKVSAAELLELHARGQNLLVKALVTERQQRGQLFVPMHWTDQFAPSAGVGKLIEPVTDPTSGQPALKMSRVTAQAAKLSVYGYAVMASRPADVDADYWALARAAGGYRLEFAFRDAKSEVQDWLTTTFRLSDDVPLIERHDKAGKRHAYALFDKAGCLVFAAYLAPEPVNVSRQWVADQLGAILSGADRQGILAGRPGTNRPDAGAVVCSCFQVGINTIAGAVSSGTCANVDEIGAALKAGTNCGSCRAEIKGIIDAYRLQAAE